MGRRYDKKGKGKKKETRESDAALRLTYLWSASHVLALQAPTASAAYVNVIRQVGRRVTLPLDALTIKRRACGRCHALLLPGTARVRVRARRERHVVVACVRCGALRRFLARPVRGEAALAAEDVAEGEGEEGREGEGGAHGATG